MVDASSIIRLSQAKAHYRSRVAVRGAGIMQAKVGDGQGNRWPRPGWDWYYVRIVGPDGTLSRTFIARNFSGHLWLNDDMVQVEPISTGPEGGLLSIVYREKRSTALYVSGVSAADFSWHIWMFRPDGTYRDLGTNGGEAFQMEAAGGGVYIRVAASIGPIRAYTPGTGWIAVSTFPTNSNVRLYVHDGVAYAAWLLNDLTAVQLYRFHGATPSLISTIPAPVGIESLAFAWGFDGVTYVEFNLPDNTNTFYSWDGSTLTQIALPPFWHFQGISHIQKIGSTFFVAESNETAFGPSLDNLTVRGEGTDNFLGAHNHTVFVDETGLTYFVRTTPISSSFHPAADINYGDVTTSFLSTYLMQSQAVGGGSHRVGVHLLTNFRGFYSVVHVDGDLYVSLYHPDTTAPSLASGVYRYNIAAATFEAHLPTSLFWLGNGDSGGARIMALGDAV